MLDVGLSLVNYYTVSCVIVSRYHGGLTGAKEAVVPVTKVVDTHYSGFRHKMAWYEAIVDWAGEADQVTNQRPVLRSRD